LSGKEEMCVRAAEADCHATVAIVTIVASGSIRKKHRIRRERKQNKQRRESQAKKKRIL